MQRLWAFAGYGWRCRTAPPVAELSRPTLRPPPSLQAPTSAAARCCSSSPACWVGWHPCCGWCRCGRPSTASRRRPAPPAGCPARNGASAARCSCCAGRSPAAGGRGPSALASCRRCSCGGWWWWWCCGPPAARWATSSQPHRPVHGRLRRPHFLFSRGAARRPSTRLSLSAPDSPTFSILPLSTAPLKYSVDHQRPLRPPASVLPTLCPLLSLTISCV